MKQRLLHFKKNAGMSLLEVLVAMTVFALVGISSMGLMSTSMNVIQSANEKLIADWVANNQLVIIKLQKRWPNGGWKKGKSEMLGSDWFYQYRGVPTEDPTFQMVEIEVRKEEKGIVLSKLKTYVTNSSR